MQKPTGRGLRCSARPRLGRNHRNPESQRFSRRNTPQGGGLPMTVHVLVSGSLFKNPELRTSSKGKAYETASIRAASADSSAADFWNLFIFSATVQPQI